MVQAGCTELAVVAAANHVDPFPCRIHYKPRNPLHRSENLTMAFDFIKVKEKIHIVNIGKRGPEGEEGRGGLGVIQVAACGAKAASIVMPG